MEADERTAVRFYGNTDRVKDTIEAGFEEPMIDVRLSFRVQPTCSGVPADPEEILVLLSGLNVG